MALRKILCVGDDTLLKTSRRVDRFDKKLHTLLDDMLETMKEANGCGLAAPQVGILRQAVIVEDEEGVIIELINPEIIAFGEEAEGIEGCLSVPGIYGIVSRPAWVTVEASDRYGDRFRRTGEGQTARAFCHELEHLKGELFTKKVIRYVDPSEESKE